MKAFRMLVVGAIALGTMLHAQRPQQLTVYTGTYTGRGGRGIYAHRFDAATGALTAVGLAAETSNPSFLAVSRDRLFLYAVNEDTPGMVTAFSIDRTAARLKKLNSVSSAGGGPCHLAFDQTGRWLFVANYGSGSISAFAIRSDGGLDPAAARAQHSGSGIDRQRQSGPHAHAVSVSPDNRFVLAADLGLDQIRIYRFDAAKGTLAPHDPAFAKIGEGVGPRHLVWSKNGGFVYVLNELKATVTTLAFDAARGLLREIQTVAALPADSSSPPSGAEIALHPGGKVLYASNRGHDSIAIFAIDPQTGMLASRGWTRSEGKTPRHFELEPSGNFLLAANQDSNNVVVFRIDPETGALRPTGISVEIPSPVCVVFD